MSVLYNRFLKLTIQNGFKQSKPVTLIGNHASTKKNVLVVENLKQITVPDKRNCITGGLSASALNIVVACQSKENDNIIKILTLYAASKTKIIKKTRGS